MSLEKTLRINALINVYGEMLNDKQREVVTQYFFYDYSLSEIAESFGITRQAVSDLINRVVNILENYEKKIKFVEKINNVNDIIDKSLNTNDESVKNALLQIKDILED